MTSPLPGVIGVHHIGVSVPDLDKAYEFYVGILGAVEEVERLQWADNPFIDSVVGLKGSAARQFFCRLGNVQIEVFEYSAPPQGPLRTAEQYSTTVAAG